MMLKLDVIANTNRLKSIHPVEKIGFTFTFLLFSILTKNLLIACITFVVMSICIVLVAKIPLIQYIRSLLLPSFFLLSSIIAILVSFAPVNELNKDTIWNVEIGTWQIFISLGSITQAYHLGATVLASISCLYFLIFTTPHHQLIWVLRRFKLPTVFIELVGLTYRFIFILLESMRNIYIAQSSRLGYQNYRVWITSAAQLIVSLFIKSIQSSRELQNAIDSRGGDIGLYEIEMKLKYNRLHLAAIFFSLTGLITITLLM